MNDVKEVAESKGFNVHIDCEDLAVIRGMQNVCLIISEEELMRGVDYRLKNTEG